MEMEFKDFKDKFVENFKEISKDVRHLFVVGVDKDEMWEVYLDSFPEGTNKVLRERREFDCSACRQFIRAFGNVVVLKNNQLTTIWGFEVEDPKYQAVISALDEYIKSKKIVDVYVTKERKIGTAMNLERFPNGDIVEWHHFSLELPQEFVTRSRETEDTIKSELRGIRNVFGRSLSELTIDSIETVIEIIKQDSLYKGEEWLSPLESFLKYKKYYDTLSPEEQNVFVWEQSVIAGPVIGKIRNHSIGTLLINLSEGMDLNTAVKKYEEIVAPTNYKRPKEIYTRQMLQKAKETITELGYMDSLPRRFATLNDINVRDVSYSNKDSVKRMQGDVFEEMESSLPINIKKFNKVEEISLEKFMNDVLPTAQELEVFFENRHRNNLVSLIAPVNKDAPSMFKWNNPFSWAYKGNITDSTIKENVKLAGGNVSGVLRCSLMWNTGEGVNPDDYDLHCITPDGNEIMYNNKIDRRNKGALDVDITRPRKGNPAVENIVFIDKDVMSEGKYKFLVHNFAYRGGKDGFHAEIEFDGQIYEFHYPQGIKHKDNVEIAEITYDMREGFSIKEILSSSMTSTDIWGIQTQNFIPVTVVMNSPNYWNREEGVGHKHVFFMLDGCVNDENPNGFYNEFIKNDLSKHKRVFEALGSRMSVMDVEDQLSGIGFSTTKRNDFLVKVKGQTERVLKVKV